MYFSLPQLLDVLSVTVFVIRDRSVKKSKLVLTSLSLCNKVLSPPPPRLCLSVCLLSLSVCLSVPRLCLSVCLLSLSVCLSVSPSLSFSLGKKKTENRYTQKETSIVVFLFCFVFNLRIPTALPLCQCQRIHTGDNGWTGR